MLVWSIFVVFAPLRALFCAPLKKLNKSKSLWNMRVNVKYY